MKTKVIAEYLGMTLPACDIPNELQRGSGAQAAMPRTQKMSGPVESWSV